MRLQQRKAKGFSLIELMIVVAIVGIISAIAYPNYTEYVTKSKRTAATSCLMEYAQYMEQYRASKMSYGGSDHSDDFDDIGLGCETENGLDSHYQFAPNAAFSATTYTIKATPIGAQASADTSCGTLSINHLGVKSASAGDADNCW